MAKIMYTQDQKNEALESIKKIGVNQTSKELNISTATLYKWQTAANGGESSTKRVKAEARKLLLDDGSQEKKIKQLEDENRQLREKNEKLKKALMAFVE